MAFQLFRLLTKMASEGGETDRMLALLIHDYLKKRNMHEVADIFAQEANLELKPVVDAPKGFLAEWWTVFWQKYCSMYPTDYETQERLMENSLLNIFPMLRTAGKKSQDIGNSHEKMLMETPLKSVCPAMLSPGISQQLGGNFPVGLNNILGQTSSNVLPTPEMIQQKDGTSQEAVMESVIPIPEMPTIGICQPRADELAIDTEQPGTGVLVSPGLDQHRAGKLPVNPEFDNMFQGPLTVNFLTERTSEEQQARLYPGEWNLNEMVHTMPALGNASHLELQASMTSRLQVSRDNRHESARGRSNQMEPTLSGKDKKNKQTSLRVVLLKNIANQITAPTKEAAKMQRMVPINQTAEKMQNDQQHHQISEMTSPTKETVETPRMTPIKQTAEKIQNVQLKHQIPEGGTHIDEDISLYEVLKSFLSDDDLSNCFSTLESSSSSIRNKLEDLCIEEVASFRTNNTEIQHCHFSSDGRLLACAGHDSKVMVGDMECYDFINNCEGHSHIVTDVRFRPSSAIFATSSFDRTVQIWDGTRPQKSLIKLSGHTAPVMSVDFHPRNVDLLCSCDSTGQIRLWNINQLACTHKSKGASRQLRFQPHGGNLLAAAAGNALNIIDIESNSLYCHLKGHGKHIRSICWDASGKYIASVSEDRALVWSASGKCIYELPNSAKKFESCIFHPTYTELLVIGSYQLLEIWNPSESSKTVSINAHRASISGLAACCESQMIASASQDKWLKLWK